MKMIKNATAVLASIAAVVAMTACSSDSSSGGGGSSSTLADGGFVKEVATNAVTNINAPFFSSTQNSQFLILAGSIEGSGNIESISFRAVNDEVATTCADANITMGHTSLSELTTTYANNVEEGKGSLQAVVQRSLSIPALTAGELFTIDLDTPFSYNGVDNLVLHAQMPTGCSNIIEIAVDTTQPNSLLHSQDVASLTGTLYAYLPNLVMNFVGGVNTQDYGGTTAHAYPFTSTNVHLQNLYTASDINGSGPITGFGLQMNAPSTVGTYTFSVKMGHSSLTNLQAVYADNSSDLKAVARDINVTVPAGLVAGDWIWIPLTGSFNYNGTDNLLVDIETSANTGSVNYVNATFMANSVRATGTDGSGTAQFVDNVLNNAKFRFNGASTDVITDGTGTTTWLFRDAAQNPTRQALYRASELGTAGKISKVACRMAALTSTETTYSNYVITMGHTTNDQLSFTFADNFDDATVVHDGNFTVPAGLVKGDWIEIPVSPFTYDGKRNLAIQFAHDGSAVIHECMMSTPDATRYPAQSLGNADRTALTESLVNDQKLDMRLWLEP